jgi:hypothetical protein
MPMPALVPPVADERDALLEYLAQQRAWMRLSAFGLSDEQAGATPTVSALSIGGLIKHVAFVERMWMDTVMRRPRNSPEANAAAFQFAPGDTLAAVLADYEEAPPPPTPPSRPSTISAKTSPSRAACRGSPTTSTPGPCAGSCFT